MNTNPLGAPMGADPKLEEGIGAILDLVELGLAEAEGFEDKLVRMFAFEFWDEIGEHRYSPGIAIWDGDE